jgi:hypothetical protein
MNKKFHFVTNEIKDRWSYAYISNVKTLCGLNFDFYDNSLNLDQCKKCFKGKF